MMKRRSEAGISLLEVLLSIAVLSVIAGVAAPIYQSFQVRNDLDTTAATVVHTIRRAQIQAQAAAGDSNAGVAVQSGVITLFQGGSYVSRDVAKDDGIAFPDSIVVSGLSEIVFEKFTGLPMSTGVLSLTSTNNETRTISINAKGMLQY